uniref:DUF4806 domain-containing protein n=1 Tax=Erpetoichthys calabaricus TaxID=27687 RepID=A0A8C4T8C4_ERPCA
MYHIVNFSECNEVELVPSNWVSNGVCAWPPYKTGDIHKAIINKYPLYPEKGHGGLLEPIPSGHLCSSCCPRDPTSNKRKRMDGWMDSLFICFLYFSTFHHACQFIVYISSPLVNVCDNYDLILLLILWCLYIVLAILRNILVKQEMMMMEQVKVILKTVQDLHEKCCSDSGSDPVLEKDILPHQDLTSIDTVWRIMRQTFTNSLAKQLNWRGINGKTCFHSLHIKDIVIDAVRRNSVTSRATTQEIEMWIKRWLHLAADRDGGRRARMECQRKNSYQESGEHYQPSNTSSKKLIRKL